MKNSKLLLYFYRMVFSISPAYVFTILLSTAFQAAAPFINIIVPKLIIDELMGGQDRGKLLLYASILILGNLFFKLLNSYFLKKVEVGERKFGFQLDSYLGNKCVDMDFENVEKSEILDLKEKAFFAIYNLSAVRRTIENGAAIINQIITLVGLGYILSILNPLIILVLLLIVCMNALLFKKMERIQYEDNQKAVYDNRAFGYYINLTSDFSMGKDVRLYNGAPLLIQKMKYFMDNLLVIYSRLFTETGKCTGLSNINVQLQIVIVYAYLAVKVIAEKITIGSFTMYAGAAKSFSDSLLSFINAFIDINQLCMYLEMFMKFDQLESKAMEGIYTKEDIKDYTIEFRNVSFAYPGKKEYTLKDISITIKPGERLSIVGLNGAGKTTFIKLLTRLYEPTSGDIYLGQTNIREIKYEEYVKLLAVVFQDFKLLSYTIRDNLNVRDGIEEQVMLEELEKAGFAKDLEKLEKGIDTSIYKDLDKSGVEFSGGQSQKLAIARALCKDSPIVILDEPTSALDPISEYEVYKSFDKLMEGKTAIYISHRLSSTRFSDKIAVFNNGMIVEYGPHSELIKQNESLYATMFKTQAKYYLEA
ncbi:ABC transporter ATP-binding protein [Anaerocolumna xylanovorans]|uniref:ATP-binding cassette, subfamily C n=1 Tax=Anaerocolumna xylanovorans DSM 12503 TaxID=1121345 RepID=A0A1M7Y1J0_9FIRM|nr:ABC transporter ATP-binding protein [Anaerocolumna xylanovorans]SHO45598.1 ATP-binding cassette, subfamily C [Anaerocolumna xylanovorans DSM 12503]